MSGADLRLMVRELLREAIAEAKARPPTTEAVKLGSDAELAGFVQRLIGLLDDPRTGSAIRSGRHRFSLQSGEPGANRAPLTKTGSPAASADTLLEGTVTEARIAKFRDCKTVTLAPKAVVTPLARDRARALGLKILRRR